jgi:hypothetical protein
VGCDKHSGALILERDFVVPDRIGIRVDVFFRPRGVWRKLLFMLGLDYPGPVLVEVDTGGNTVYSDSQRTFYRFVVIEQSYVAARRGKGVVRAMLNPEDYNRKWNVSIGVAELNN